MTKTALVIGGTGPTGPHVLNGLIDRGYDVSIFHRGTHVPPDLPDVRRIIGDPHFRESIDEAVGKGEYDLVLATYGRTKHLAQSFEGRAGKFMSIGGTPRYSGFFGGEGQPSGTTIPMREESPLVDVSGYAPDQIPKAARFGAMIVDTERAIFKAHPNATHFVYPVVYGPRNLIPWEWSIIKRINDGRKVIPLPDDGAAIHSRGAARNLAHMILLAVDKSEAAAGQIFNAGDEVQLSLRQWVETIIEQMGATDVDIVGVSSAVAPILKAIYIPTANSICPHSIIDVSKARTLLGYKDLVTPAEALAESIKYYAENPVPADAKISAFIDQFDYALEDRILESWWQYLDSVGEQIPQFLPDDEHPMPHPKRPGQKVDEKNR